MKAIFSSSSRRPLVVSVKRKFLFASLSTLRAYSTVAFTVSKFMVGSPPKKSISRLRRAPEFFIRKSTAFLPVSMDIFVRDSLWDSLFSGAAFGVDKSSDAKQYLQLRLQSWDMCRHRDFTTGLRFFVEFISWFFDSSSVKSWPLDIRVLISDWASEMSLGLWWLLRALVRISWAMSSRTWTAPLFTSRVMCRLFIVNEWIMVGSSPKP